MIRADELNRVVLRDAATGRWLRFSQPQQVICAWETDEVLGALQQVERLAEAHGLYAAGWISYEAAPAFDPALCAQPMTGFPRLWFGLYPPPKDVQLPEVAEPKVLTSMSWTPSVDRDSYNEAIAQIKEHIARGDTYQVNYTMRLRSPFCDDPWQLFLELVQAQPSNYAAFVDVGEYVLCSASPELFFDLSGDRITSKPMKGTASRGRTLAEDQAKADWLSHSEKNRAENVMIVDMVRNDLGRVARIGSVRWPRLFEVERYPTVWQMTSTVEADTTATLCEIMQALFPCASITGAPKVRTMQIIAELETTPRRAYTGCIGYYAPSTAHAPRRAQFNVAIRTVLVERATRQAEYGVGGGIVWDSTSKDEYEECLVKARVLTRRQPHFELLESLLWQPDSGGRGAGFSEADFFLLEAHLKRLADSAVYFQFKLDIQEVIDDLMEQTVELPPVPHKVRLTVAKDGRVSCQALPLGTVDSTPVHLRLARAPIDSSDPFLYHKTTHREVYEKALAGVDSDDVILWNERGELTETCTANLALKIDGEWLTPAVNSGLLAGVYRGWLLERGEMREAVLRLEDLQRAEALAVLNSVRRWRLAVWLDSGSMTNILST